LATPNDENIRNNKASTIIPGVLRSVSINDDEESKESSAA